MKNQTSSSNFVHALGTLPINTHNGKYSCYVEILDRIASQLQAMLSYHSRVTVIRFDLHLYRSFSDNTEVSKLMVKIKKRLKAKYGSTRLGYIWVRELEKAKKHHYHIVLFVNGNMLQHPSNLLAWIERRWTARGHPKPYIPSHCYYVIERKTNENLDLAFYRLSYLAKVRGKGKLNRDNSVNDYSGSRLKLRGKSIDNSSS